MIKKSNSTRSSNGGIRYVLLNGNDAWRKQLGRRHTAVCSTPESMRQAAAAASSASLWISTDKAHTRQLLRVVSDYSAQQGRPVRFGTLLMLEPPNPRSLPSLCGLFDRVVGEVSAFKTLPMDQLAEVFAAPRQQSRDMFIGGVVDRESGTIALVRGDFTRLTVPLSLFRPSGKSTPDFRFFELDDYGQTLRFGDYEATADAVLWQVDRDYRAKANARERAAAKGLGPSLRRLRIQRGLSQADFPRVSRKTISRIESGQIRKPHIGTLQRIATTLDVAPKDIESF